MSEVYEPPTLIEIGGFTELTGCLPWPGPCIDFLGCGWAIFCI